MVRRGRTWNGAGFRLPGFLGGGDMPSLFGSCAFLGTFFWGWGQLWGWSGGGGVGSGGCGRGAFSWVWSLKLIRYFHGNYITWQRNFIKLGNDGM